MMKSIASKTILTRIKMFSSPQNMSQFNQMIPDEAIDSVMPARTAAPHQITKIDETADFGDALKEMADI